MQQTSVRAVFRVNLPPNRAGEIRFEVLDRMDCPFSPGSSLVLDVGEGWWTRRSELLRILPALSNVAHVSITGTHLERSGGQGDFHLLYGLGQISDCLQGLLDRRTAPAAPAAVAAVA